MSVILQCEDLTKRYKNGDVTALDGVNLSLEKGRIVGLLGPNGSGKTTLIKLANGLLPPSGGRVTLNGSTPGSETKRISAFLPDTEYLPGRMKLDAVVGMFADFFADFDRQKAEGMLKDLNLPMDSRLKRLSKGSREKVQLILTMSRRAEVYFLDEPLSGVDPAARAYILDTILSNYPEEALVLISTHLIADVEAMLDEAVFLSRGTLLFHRNADELRETEGMSVDAYFREVFKC